MACGTVGGKVCYHFSHDDDGYAEQIPVSLLGASSLTIAAIPACVRVRPWPPAKHAAVKKTTWAGDICVLPWEL